MWIEPDNSKDEEEFLKKIQDAESDEELDQADWNAVPKTIADKEYKIAEVDKENFINYQIKNNKTYDNDLIYKMQEINEIESDKFNGNRKISINMIGFSFYFCSWFISSLIKKLLFYLLLIFTAVYQYKY